MLLCLLLLPGCAGQQDLRSLTILHLNDLHAHLLPDADGRGGFAHVASAIAAERAKSPGALVLHGGDLVQGSPVSTLFEGQPVWEIANHIGLDVNTLGNHEFDYGWWKIPGFLQAVDFPTVTANVVDANGELLTPQAYTIVEVNEVRVAVIGLVTATLDRLSRTEHLGRWKALPVAEGAQRLAAQLSGQADLVVVLAHITDEEEDYILRDAPAVDVVISGHAHGGQQQVKELDGRIAVKVRAYGVELGKLGLDVDVDLGEVASYRWQRLPITSDLYHPDPVVEELVDHWEQQVSDRVDIRIGQAGRSFRREELQTWIEKVMRETVGADLAYMNLGGIRAGLRRGPILIRDLWNIEPFGNRIAYGRILGSHIPPEARGGLNINADREYVLATNDFIAAQWRERGQLDLAGVGPPLREVLVEWVRQRGGVE